MKFVRPEAFQAPCLTSAEQQAWDAGRLKAAIFERMLGPYVTSVVTEANGVLLSRATTSLGNFRREVASSCRA